MSVKSLITYICIGAAIVLSVASIVLSIRKARD